MRIRSPISTAEKGDIFFGGKTAALSSCMCVLIVRKKKIINNPQHGNQLPSLYPLILTFTRTREAHAFHVVNNKKKRRLQSKKKMLEKLNPLQLQLL